MLVIYINCEYTYIRYKPNNNNAIKDISFNTRTIFRYIYMVRKHSLIILLTIFILYFIFSMVTQIASCNSNFEKNLIMLKETIVMNTIDLKAFDEKQKELIRLIIPENLQKQIEANYDKFISLKNDFK